MKYTVTNSIHTVGLIKTSKLNVQHRITALPGEHPLQISSRKSINTVNKSVRVPSSSSSFPRVHQQTSCITCECVYLSYYHHRDRRRLRRRRQRRRIPPCSEATLSRNSLLLCLAHQSCSSSPSHPALLIAADDSSTFVRPKLANLFTVQGHLWSPSIQMMFASIF